MESNIILYIAASLDMYIARENGDVDWLFQDGDYGYEKFYSEIGYTLMGSKTYEQVLSFGEWPYKEKINYVFTREAGKEDTDQVKFFSGDIPSFLKKLKQQAKEHIWLIGGGEIIRICLSADLVDELRIFVHPIVLGKGIPLFIPQEQQINFQLKKVNPFPNGLLELHYQK
ncbi:MAG: dihydrofolate reductase family protein [Bacteroidota bacterium]